MVEIAWKAVLYRAESQPICPRRAGMALPRGRWAPRVVPGLEILGCRIPEPVPCLILQPVPVA
jgi:hypothetical protein